MSNILNLVRRDDDNEDDSTMDPTIQKLLITLIVLVVIALCLVAGLLYLRRRRNGRETNLPMYHERRNSASSTSSHHHRRRQARPSHSIHIYHDKLEYDEKSSRPSTPGSPVPEIRITFPEEVDDAGKRQSGRCVVVHVGDNGVGMEPYEEKLPAYQTEEGRMQSVDLERVGGLVEKERKPLGW